MSNKTAVILGAGKIARGFVGHLLGNADYTTTFVDVNPDLVRVINERNQYTVHILGAPDKDTVVTGVSAVTPENPALATALQTADIVFVSVGGKNLTSAAETLAAGIALRLKYPSSNTLNVVVCENWRAAGETLRLAIVEALPSELRNAFSEKVGVAESTIMRSAIAATPAQLTADPLAVQAQDFWLLPIDGDAIVGTLPSIPGLEAVKNFTNALERKLYTYNTGNATISYLGWLRGHTYLSEAANDPAIAAIVRGTYEEMGEAMVSRFGYEVDDQRRYAQQSLSKFQDAAIVDPIARQVNDPLRKLSRHDRLVGAALVAIEEGVSPQNVAVGIAAALRHRNPEDPSAVKLAALVAELGEAGALALVGGIAQDHELVKLVVSKFAEVDRLIRVE